MQDETDESHILIGIWKLVDVTDKDADGNRLRSSYGPKKMGVITFNDDHRMSVVMSDGREHLPSKRQREFLAYSGRYRFDGKVLKTLVDCASAGRVALYSEQVRPVRIEGNRVTLTAPPANIEGVITYRELTWEKIS